MGFMAQSLGVDMADIMSGGEMVTALFTGRFKSSHLLKGTHYTTRCECGKPLHKASVCVHLDVGRIDAQRLPQSTG
jgi:hypothetical protein